MLAILGLSTFTAAQNFPQSQYIFLFPAGILSNMSKIHSLECSVANCSAHKTEFFISSLQELDFKP